MPKQMKKVSMPDSLIPPNSDVRGMGCGKCGGKKNKKGKKGKGITVDLKRSAKDGIERSKPAPGWGSNAGNNYDPVPPAVPRF